MSLAQWTAFFGQSEKLGLQFYLGGRYVRRGFPLQAAQGVVGEGIWIWQLPNYIPQLVNAKQRLSG